MTLTLLFIGAQFAMAEGRGDSEAPTPNHILGYTNYNEI